MNVARVPLTGAKWFAKGVEKEVEKLRNNSLVGSRHKRNGWPRHYQHVWGFQSIWIIANSTANALPELSFAICHPITRIQSNPLHSRITEIALPFLWPFRFNIIPPGSSCLYSYKNFNFIFLENLNVKSKAINNWWHEKFYRLEGII